MRLVQQGDTDALGDLFDRYSSLIEKIAVRILRDISEAQDLVQDVFLYVYRKSHIFDPARGPFGSWLVQIAYTRAFTRREQLKRRDLTDCARIEELADSATTDISLQPLLEGYSLREISSRLKQSLSNTRHHYYRGIEKLKEVLESPCAVPLAKKDEN